MFNCVIVKANGRPWAVVPTMDYADILRDYLRTILPRDCEIFCDWAYIPNLPF